MFTGQGAGTIFLLLGQAASPPFFSLYTSFLSLPVSIPFLSRPLESSPYSSSSLPSIPARGRKWLCVKWDFE